MTCSHDILGYKLPSAKELWELLLVYRASDLKEVADGQEDAFAEKASKEILALVKAEHIPLYKAVDSVFSKAKNE
jgi:hypothetical protein